MVRGNDPQFPIRNSFVTNSEIFSRMSDALAGEALSHLRSAERGAYDVAVSTLAAQRRFRPVFIERKPTAERHAWMRRELGRPLNEALAANILGAWLTGSQHEMLATFMDATGVPHDGKGGIQDLPPQPDAEKLRAAVDGLLEKFPREHVAVYLQAFHASEPSSWPALGEMLAGDPRLQLGATTVTA